MVFKRWVLVAALLVNAGAVGAVDVPSAVDKTVEKIAEKLPEIRMKETIVEVTPEAWIYLPSGSLDLSLRQEFSRTIFNFSSQYDFVDNFMNFNLDFLYKTTPLPFGITLDDRVDFNEIFADIQYLQRSQSMTPYILYALSPTAKIKTSLKIENTYTSSLGSLLVIDQGKNILGEVGVSNNTIITSTGIPRGGQVSFAVQHSFPNLGSDYYYTAAEFSLHRFHTLVGRHYIEYALRAGYPIETITRPLTALYYAGGYRLLRGYNFKEFRGDALVYGMLTYHVPIAQFDRDHFLGIPFSVVTWDVFAETAKIGSRDIYAATSAGVKSAAGTGFGYKMVLFKRLPVELNLAAAKAFEARQVQFYFSVSTMYYSWGNQ